MSVCVFMPNCVSTRQAELLTGSSVTNVEEAHRAAGELLRRGCGSVIVTLGPRGCVVTRAEDTAPKHVPTVPVTSVDTTVRGRECFFSLLVPVFPCRNVIPSMSKCSSIILILPIDLILSRLGNESISLT